jgi:hypothetical protein
VIFLFGEKIKASIVKEGTFNCPICHSQQSYSDVQEKGYFTLMFIPTFPISVHAQYRLCHQCQNSYDIDFLDQPAYVSLLQMVLSYLLNQYGTQHAKTIAAEIHQDETSLEWSQEKIQEAVTEVKNWETLVKCIKRHRKNANYESRCKVLIGVVAFIAKIEPINYESRVQINMIASHLEIDPLDVNQIVNKLS